MSGCACHVKQLRRIFSGHVRRTLFYLNQQGPPMTSSKREANGYNGYNPYPRVTHLCGVGASDVCVLGCLLLQDECSSCRSCKLQLSRSGERAVQCPSREKHWRPFGAGHLQTSLLNQSVVASFQEEHGHLLRSLRRYVTGSVGQESVWDALIGAGNGSSLESASSSSSLSSSSSSSKPVPTANARPHSVSVA